MLGYRVPAPDEAMLISVGTIPGGTQFRVVTGHGAVVMPFFRNVRFLTLAMCEAEVEETCVTHQGISLNVRAVIAFKVGNDPESIINAGQRFLSDQNQMSVLTGRIFAGHLRSIIGSLTVEQIIQERQKLAIEVLDGSKEEMARIGLTVDALQIQSIDDGKLGYILAIAAPHNAAIQRQAQIAQAQANQAAAEQISQRNQAEYARQSAVVQAQYRAEVDTAQAEAAQAGPLAKAQAQRSVIAAQTELAQREAELRQQQLVAEVVKPAEAEAERVRILAVADAEKMKIQAEAAASHNRVALDRMLIDQLPEIVKQAASGIAGANVTVLNGADGIGEIASGLVGQGMAIFESLRGGIRQTDHDDGQPNGTDRARGQLAPPADGATPATSREYPGRP